MKFTKINIPAMAGIAAMLLTACGGGGDGGGETVSSTAVSSRALSSSAGAVSSQLSSSTLSSSSAVSSSAVAQPVDFTQVEQKEMLGDGSVQTVSEELSVEANETLLPEFEQMRFTRHTAQNGVADTLRESFVMKSDFYKVESAGDYDSVGRATLRFKSTAPGDRIVYIIDGNILGMLDTEPEEGVLTVSVRVPGRLAEDDCFPWALQGSAVLSCNSGPQFQTTC